MTEAVAPQDGLLDGGPLLKLQHTIGLKRPNYPRCFQWAVLAVMIGWVPLLLLSALEGTLLLQGKGFLFDIAVHARSLIAVPVLILAELISGRILSPIARQFIDADIISKADRPRYDAAVASTLRLRDSTLVEIVLIVLAYTIVIATFRSVPIDMLPIWYVSGADVVASRSLGGWWHALVSLPLLNSLLLGWIWYLFIWARFLWLVSRLDLQLIPAHPDHAGGLMFLAPSLRAFSVIAFAMGVIVAGTLANGILHTGAQLMDNRLVVVGLVVFVLVLFCSPLLVFSQRLVQAQLRGIAEYGALAGRLGHQFESQWLARGKRDKSENAAALEVPDFSATTDLYQIVANVYDMQVVPLTLKSPLPLIAATLLPFSPVALLIFPFDVLLSKITGLMF